RREQELFGVGLAVAAKAAVVSEGRRECPTPYAERPTAFARGPGPGDGCIPLHVWYCLLDRVPDSGAGPAETPPGRWLSIVLLRRRVTGASVRSGSPARARHPGQTRHTRPEHRNGLHAGSARWRG